MKLISVNIGSERTQPKGDGLETTGIYKTPTLDPVKIEALGIGDDFICDKKNHGGLDQAIYVYGVTDYEWWSKELGREVEPGTFGENLTISDLESAKFNIGDRLHVGGVILEITAPRIPCSTLARRMQDSHFVKQYRHAERPGLYCRVLREGVVETGDEVAVERFIGEAVTIGQAFRDYYEKLDEHSIYRYLGLPIASRWRKELMEDLEKLHSESQSN